MNDWDHPATRRELCLALLLGCSIGAALLGIAAECWTCIACGGALLAGALLLPRSPSSSEEEEKKKSRRGL